MILVGTSPKKVGSELRAEEEKSLFLNFSPDGICSDFFVYKSYVRLFNKRTPNVVIVICVICFAGLKLMFSCGIIENTIYLARLQNWYTTRSLNHFCSTTVGNSRKKYTMSIIEHSVYVDHILS